MDSETPITRLGHTDVGNTHQGEPRIEQRGKTKNDWGYSDTIEAALLPGHMTTLYHRPFRLLS